MYSNISIDPRYSVYHLLKGTSRPKISINQLWTMQTVSYEIENSTNIDRANGVIFAGFQRMSRFLPQQERYRQLAAVTIVSMCLVYRMPALNAHV